MNYITEPTKNSKGDFKDKAVSLFKTNTPKQTVYVREKKLKENIKIFQKLK